ncbi:MAG: hypothetical protein ACPGUC_10805, partial [Gammaproteobacteria bacterium]
MGWFAAVLVLLSVVAPALAVESNFGPGWIRNNDVRLTEMQLVLERLLLKGNVVVKKAYCDWDRYKEFRSVMHDTAF